MKMFYRDALLAAGYDEKSEMFKEVNKIFDSEAKKHKRDRERDEELGITVNHLSAFEDEDGNPCEFFSTDENVEEKILHEIELEALRECVFELSADDRYFLMKLYKDEIPLRQLAKTMGVNHQKLMYRRDKLLKLLRQKMSQKKY